MFLLLFAIFQLVLAIWEARDLRNDLAKAIREFQGANPVPWSEADHKFLADVRKQREALGKQAMHNFTAFGIVLALVIGARKPIGQYVNERRTNTPSEPLPLR